MNFEFVAFSGLATTEKPNDEDLRKNKDIELIYTEDPPPTNDHLYVLLGCLFAGFWIIMCIACALCYKCKQKRGMDKSVFVSGIIDADYWCWIICNCL